MERYRNEECYGHIAARCHRTHDLSIECGILWCRSCGAYTSRQPRALKQPCPRKPPSEAAANVRARLAKGLPPTTAAYLTGASIAVSGSGVHDGPTPMTSAPTPTHYQNDNGDHRDIEQQTMRLPTHTDSGRPPTPIVSKKSENAYLSSRYRILDQRRGHDLQPQAAETYASDDAPRSTAELPRRRRITGKRTVGTDFSAPDLTETMNKARCNPAVTQPWSTRLAIGRTAVARPCHICENLCRGQCTGCYSALCISCARARRACRAANAGSGYRPTAEVFNPPSSSPASSSSASRPVHHHHGARAEGHPRFAAPTIASWGTSLHPSADAATVQQAAGFAAVPAATSKPAFEVPVTPAVGVEGTSAPSSSSTAAAAAARASACSVLTVYEVPACAAADVDAVSITSAAHT